MIVTTSPFAPPPRLRWPGGFRGMKAEYIKRLGVRASGYIDDPIRRISTRGGATLVADRYETPAGIARTLTRVFGRPTIHGEVAYWDVSDAFSE